LGIPANADEQLIKKAFRQLALKHHPDKTQNLTSDNSFYLLLQEAYKTLSDPEKRKSYDTELWLSQKGTFFKNELLSPKILIQQLERFATATLIQQQYTVLEDSKTAFLLDALRIDHINAVLPDITISECSTIVDYVIFIAKDLPKSFRDRVMNRLAEAFEKVYPEVSFKIEIMQQQKKSGDWLERNKIKLFFAVGMLLCMIMYWYAQKG
jgi:curved DNA-binding protein CbpA